MICVQSEATAPIVRAFQSGETDITPAAPGRTLATGLNVAQNVGHINVLRILRETGGHALAVSDQAIRRVIRSDWAERRFAWSPEGAATLAVLPELVDRSLIRPGDRVVVVNTASAENYLPSIRELIGRGFWAMLGSSMRSRLRNLAHSHRLIHPQPRGM
jgi:threonine synthase